MMKGYHRKKTPCATHLVILIDSVYKKGYYPKALSEEFKYIVAALNKIFGKKRKNSSKIGQHQETLTSVSA